MAFIIHNVEQGTPEWHKLREGLFTASKAQALSAAGAGLKTVVEEMVLKEIGVELPDFKNHHMERGNEQEPLARIAYEFETGRKVHEVGFITNPMLPGLGASPDGLVKGVAGWERGCEIKARSAKIHWSLLKFGKPDSSAVWQCQQSMLVSGLPIWDFVSFNPDFKQSLFIKTIEADPKAHQRLLEGLNKGKELLIAERSFAAYQREVGN